MRLLFKELQIKARAHKCILEREGKKYVLTSPDSSVEDVLDTLDEVWSELYYTYIKPPELKLTALDKHDLL